MKGAQAGNGGGRGGRGGRGTGEEKGGGWGLRRPGSDSRNLQFSSTDKFANFSEKIFETACNTAAMVYIIFPP